MYDIYICMIYMFVHIYDIHIYIHMYILMFEGYYPTTTVHIVTAVMPLETFVDDVIAPWLHPNVWTIK